jgi:hypothetical protein
MKRSPLPRKTANLSESVNRYLDMYALAAGAAGVTMLALVQPAEAKIVYTRANHRIPTNTVFAIDINHDGIFDFEFSYRTASHTSVSSIYARLRVKGIQRGNKVWAVRSAGHSCAAALPKNTRVGPKSPFQSGSLTMFERNSHAGVGSYFCPWFNPKYQPSYLALKFVIKGQVHYAWARVDFVHGAETLISYAYETVPNTPIITGKTKGPDSSIEAPNAALTAPTPDPSTLGMLALGAPALSIWRRENSVRTTQ